MPTVYLRNHDRSDMVLKYQSENGRHQELLVSNLSSESVVTPGFYVHIDNSFLGVFASSKGPVFFQNEKQFALADDNYRASLMEGSQKNIFSLSYKNEVRLEVAYPPPKFKDYDNWSDETSLDFFLWLTDALSKTRERFVSYYTR